MTHPLKRRALTDSQRRRPTRRDFLRATFLGAGAVLYSSALGALLTGCGDEDPILPPGATTIDVDTTLAQFSLLAVVGGHVALESGDLFGLPPDGVLILRHSATQATVLDRTCTFGQCQVGPFIANVTTCPCNGSQFSTDGGVVRGPAVFALQQYASTIDGSIIRITI